MDFDVVPKNLAPPFHMQTTIPFEKIDEHVRERYQCSFMSNRKWKKLLNRVGDLCSSGFALRCRLIHGNEVVELLLDEVDDQFFAEPIHYKEVEWIEFPDEFEDWVDPNNRKAGREAKPQDLIKIRDAIRSLGQFEIDDLGRSVRVYGYR